MKEINLTNSISENQISIGFNLNDDNVPVRPITIDISGDIDLNALVNQILGYLERNRKFKIEYLEWLESVMIVFFVIDKRSLISLVLLFPVLLGKNIFRIINFKTGTTPYLYFISILSFGHSISLRP